MALVQLNLRPSKTQLRDFGDTALCMCNLIGFLLLWADRIPVRGFVILCGIGTVIYLLSRISARLVKPLYLGLILATWPIGWVVSHAAMALFYYGIVTPLGLLFRGIGRDVLCRRRDPQAATYWAACRPTRADRDYFRQF